MGSRTWIKVYCKNWIEGTIREEFPEVRCVWIDLLALVGNSQHSDTGELKLSNNVGYTDNQISGILRINEDLWLTAKERFIDTERIEVMECNMIRIKNWTKYQEDYSRQARYKLKKSLLNSKERDIRS
jgi:hypothetical protein